MKAVCKHTDNPWVILYINRWLKAPFQMQMEQSRDGQKEPHRACAKNVLGEHDAVSEMKVDPSKSVCRSRLQTAVSCFNPKSCGSERYG